MVTAALRELCGVRSGDKGDFADLTLFADDAATFEFLVDRLTSDLVAAHFGATVTGPVQRFLAPNVLAIKFVLAGALDGGGPRSLRSDNLGKALGGALLRLQIDVPRELLEQSARYRRRAPLPTPESWAS